LTRACVFSTGTATGHDRSEPEVGSAEPARSVDLPRCSLSLDVARYQGALQTDRLWGAVGAYPAVVGHVGLLLFLREIGGYSFGRHSLSAFHVFWPFAMDLLFYRGDEQRQ